MSKILIFAAGITLGTLVGLTAGRQFAMLAVTKANRKCIKAQMEWRDLAVELRDNWLGCLGYEYESDP